MKAISSYTGPKLSKRFGGLNILEKLLKFTKSDLQKYGREIAKVHIKQAQKGIGVGKNKLGGNTFTPYTAEYRRRKGANKTGLKQKSTRTSPPDLTLTGDMFSAFGFLDAKVDGELALDYGIGGGREAVKMQAHALGRFGRPSKKSKITRKPNKKRIVAKNGAVGPMVEKAIGNMFLGVFLQNLRRLTGRPIVINM
nr:hypothetical protein [uncultured Mediterranean phage uvMED]